MTEWYTDDGHSHAHLQGSFKRRNILHLGHERWVQLTACEGLFPQPYTEICVFFHGLGTVEAAVDGHSFVQGVAPVRMIEPLRSYDPFGSADPPFPWHHGDVPFVRLPWSDEPIEIRY
jgi:hypothetical protein